MVSLALALAYAGFVALCLAMDRHHGQVFRHRAVPWQRQALRLVGWLLLAASLPACIAGWGWPVGLVAWFGILSAAGLLLVFLLPYAPRVTAALALALPLCAVPLLLF